MIADSKIVGGFEVYQTSDGLWWAVSIQDWGFFGPYDSEEDCLKDISEV